MLRHMQGYTGMESTAHGTALVFGELIEILCYIHAEPWLATVRFA